MATAAPTPAQAELISSLTQDEIPIKLRCAICSRLAVNAFRLPCCEQAICETCHSFLSSSCPVCEHTPIAAEDCKPHKSLRTTIKVFLRTEEKKREASKAKELKELKDTPPVTPIEPPAVEILAEIPVETPAPAVEEPVETPVEELAEDAPAPTEEKVELANDDKQTDSAHSEEQQDIPQQSVEEVPPGQESNEDADAEGTNEGNEKTGEETTQVAMPGFGHGFGFDTMSAGGFPNMGMNGTSDYNQMQMVMSMQNGMGPNGFGSFPMMGMPGMSMDTMAMQSMFMNGGFGGGMGMMGMGDFNGSMMGNNFNGGNWNSTQQTWNHGNQNNFNQANAVAGAHGDFGAAAHHQNFPAARGNFHQQYNDYSQNNGAYGWRGGRGGRGRGASYGGRSNFYGNFGEQAMPSHFGSGGANIPSDTTIPTGPKADSTTNVDEFGREARAASEKPLDLPDSGDTAQDQDAGAATELTGPHDEQTADLQDGNGARPIQTLDETHAAPYDHRYVQDFSHNPYAYQGHAWHNGYNSMPPPVMPDVPVNAPTGPKAMREGNMNVRGRGFSIVGRGGARVLASIAQEVHSERSTSRTAEPECEKEKSRTRSRSPRKEEDRASETGSRRERRRHRHRSNSRSEDEEDRERRRERRRRRDRRHEEEQEVYDDKEESKTREASPTESRRSGHRSRRDRDKERERDRDHKSSRSHRSSHRSQRDRSKERSREHKSRRHHDEDDGASLADADTKGDEDKGSSSNRRGGKDRDRDRESKSGRDKEDRVRDRSSCHGKSQRDEERPSRHGTSHRERSDRESDRDRTRRKESDRDKERDKELSSSKAAPAIDPHTLEREARNRERLLKEAQRIAGLAGIAGISGKRGRDEHEGGGSRRSKHRRRSSGRGYEGAGDEPDEERIARGESKRESSRWE